MPGRVRLYLDLRKDTNNCPFPRFLPLGRISCEGAGNGHFLIIVVNFGFCAFWADLTLLCINMRRFFWAEIPGKKAEIPGKRVEIPGQVHHDAKMENMKWQFFLLEMVIFILKWVNLRKMDRNQTKICPGKKFVTNEYPGIGKVHPVAGRCRLPGRCRWPAGAFRGRPVPGLYRVTGWCRLPSGAGGRERCAAWPVPVASRCRLGNLSNDRKLPNKGR